MALDWNEGALAEGLACYRNSQFFEAHEHWESVWLTSIPPEKSFLQGLIQLTVALHHLQAGNHAGARSLMKRVHRRLEECPACFREVDVALLRKQVVEWIGMLNGQVDLASMSYPRISLLSNSRESEVRPV